MLNKTGRLILVNSVLTAIPTFYITVFSLQKWAIKKIDKIRRSFLWRGSENANDGHCLVNWGRVMRPKKISGLGILDLDMFSRALRLHWLWFAWHNPDRPWVGTEPPVNETDRHLFRASTVVTIGNGLKAEFWNSSWLQGLAPRDLAPNLYKLAWRKHRRVFEEVTNANWTHGLWRMSTVTEMAEFVELWDRVQGVQFTDSQDELHWRWTANGEYTAKSTYSIQFSGSFTTVDSQVLWKAPMEGKHKFFAWLLVQSKILTADKLLLRNWNCNLLCALCTASLETADHLCLHCPFAMQVWSLATAWSENLIQLPPANCTTEDWWRLSLRALPKSKRRTKAALLIYFAWNIWKERNRRVFQGRDMTSLQIFHLAKKEMDLRHQAYGANNEAVVF